MRYLAAAVMLLFTAASSVPAPIDVDPGDITFTVQYRVVGDATYNWGNADSIKDADTLHRQLLAAIERPDTDLNVIYREGRLAWTRIKVNNP